LYSAVRIGPAHCRPCPAPVAPVASGSHPLGTMTLTKPGILPELTRLSTAWRPDETMASPAWSRANPRSSTIAGAYSLNRSRSGAAQFLSCAAQPTYPQVYPLLCPLLAGQNRTQSGKKACGLTASRCIAS